MSSGMNSFLTLYKKRTLKGNSNTNTDSLTLSFLEMLIAMCRGSCVEVVQAILSEEAS
jgi:hypothetical protein